MSSIHVKSAPPADPWPPQKQIVAHILGHLSSVDPKLNITGRNRWGMPEAIFHYGRDLTTKQAFVVDVDIVERRASGAAHVQTVPLGIHLMCPRCFQSLYIRTADSPSGVGRPSHEIEIHWTDRQCASDGYWRPTFTVGGPIRCENLLSTSQRATPDTSGLCNWRGGIIRGRGLDHTI